MLTHEELKKSMLNNPKVKSEYDALQEEFSLFDELLKARIHAGLTQAEVADRMGTKTPAVARLENGGGNKQHSPSISTLRKYAKAVDCHLEIKLVHY
jgi:transcriptional regulator, XRE family